MFHATTLFSRGYVVKPLPINFTPTERFLRGSMRLWSRQVGDRRLKGTVPLAGFLEFVARRSAERRTRAVDLAATGDGEEEPAMLNAWRMLSKARTVDVNDVTETVHLRPYFDYQTASFYGTIMRCAAYWKHNEKVPIKQVMHEYFPDMSLEDFINAQSLIDEFIGMKDDAVFVVNRYGEDDYTFLLRRALWSADEDGIPLAQLEARMKELWNLENEIGEEADGSNLASRRSRISGKKQKVDEYDDDDEDDFTPPNHSLSRTLGLSGASAVTSSPSSLLPSLPFRCKTPQDVLNEHLADWYFSVEDNARDTGFDSASSPSSSSTMSFRKSSSSSSPQVKIFYFGWEAVLREVIRAMPVTGWPSYVFRRAVLAHHPCLAHSHQHGTWKAMLDRMQLRYDEWITISVARTDNTTHIVRRLLPSQAHSRANSVTSETISILSLMESFTKNDASSLSSSASSSLASSSTTHLPFNFLDQRRQVHPQQHAGNSWISFDDVARCMTADVKSQVDSAESIYQLLKISRFIQPDVRLFVRETSSRAASETIVLLDSSAVEGGADNIPKILLQANPVDAPHGTIICARKKHEPSFFASQTAATSSRKTGEDVVAPTWMPNSVILVAQLAKLIATRGSEQPQDASKPASVAATTRQLKNIIVIVSDSEDKKALRDEIKTLVGENVEIEFASPKLISK